MKYLYSTLHEGQFELSYWQFEQSVKRDARHVFDPQIQSFLDGIKRTSATRHYSLPAGTNLWRAQHGFRTPPIKRKGINGVPYIDNLSSLPLGKKRMKPLRDRASEGRANPKGIPYLYLAEDKETAMSEIRPWVGGEVTVARFKTAKDLILIDCANDTNDTREYSHVIIDMMTTDVRMHPETTAEEWEQMAWSELNNAFSEPVTRGDDTADYVATQILAEVFRSAGADGVRYKSRLGKNGKSVALFDIDTAEVKARRMYTVEGVNFRFKRYSNIDWGKVPDEIYPGCIDQPDELA